MRVRAGLAALLAVLIAGAITIGAATSGDPVELDTVSDIAGLMPAGYSGLPAATVFDDSIVHDYEITLSDENWDFLNANPVLEQYVPATLKYRGKTYDEIGLRYKGYFGSLRFCFTPTGERTCKKLPLKLNFNEYDAAGRFYGLRVVNLHAMERDPTKMHEMLGYEMFRQAGVPAPRTAYARVTVNGELLGLFLAVEEIDREFVRYQFPDAGRGTLFREVWPEGTGESEYAAGIEFGDLEDAEAMQRFDAEVLGTPEDQFVETLGRWMDVDELMNYLAVDRLIENFDGIVGWYCTAGDCFNHNYYWYKEAFTDRVWLIPWDLDSAMTFPAPIRTYYRMPDWDAPKSCNLVPVFLGLAGRPPSCDEFTRRLASQAWDQYAAASRSLLDDEFQIEKLQARVDELRDLIADTVAEDPRGPAPEEWRVATAKLRSDLLFMRGYVETKISAPRD